MNAHKLTVSFTFGCDGCGSPSVASGEVLCARCKPPTTRSSVAKYLGPCWETFTTASGSVELRKRFAYRAKNGERYFAETEAAALESVSS